MTWRRDSAFDELDRAVALSPDDWAFVGRLQANEDAAYDELVRTYHGSMYHAAFRMLGDPADASDVVQDIFIKVFRSIRSFKGEASLKTWMYKIAFSEILNRLRWWRRRHRHATFSIDEPAVDASGSDLPAFELRDHGPGPAEILESKEREAAIQAALERLSSDHRSIVILRDIEGFAYNEIADILGISIGTVKSRLARARCDLKQSLMQYLSVQRV